MAKLVALDGPGDPGTRPPERVTEQQRRAWSALWTILLKEAEDRPGDNATARQGDGHRIPA